MGLEIPTDILDRPTSEAARLLALAYLEAARGARRRMDDLDDREAVHDFRVSVRRLRTIARAYRRPLVGSIDKKQRRHLASWQSATGAARDLQVLLAWLDAQRRALPEELAEQADLACEDLGRDVARAARQAAKTAGRHFDAQCGRIEEKLSRIPWIAFGPGGRHGEKAEGPEALSQTGGRARMSGSGLANGAPLRLHLARRIETERHALTALVAAYRDHHDIARLHDARIVVKRIRYLVDPFKSMLKFAPAMLITVRRWQDLLGELHDLSVFSDVLPHSGTIADAGKVATAVGDGSEEHLAARDRSRRRAPSLPDWRTTPALAAALRSTLTSRFTAIEGDLRDLSGNGLQLLGAEIDAVVAELGPPRDNLEIERKYLLRSLPPATGEVAAIHIDQGWIPGERLRERLRRTRSGDDARWIRTLKFGSGLSRIEIEEETSEEVFESLWALTAGCRVSKRRYRIEHDGLTWEIDAFDDRTLFLAEVELDAPDRIVELPHWLSPYVVREVTEESAYVNLNLAR